MTRSLSTGAKGNGQAAAISGIMRAKLVFICSILGSLGCMLAHMHLDPVAA